MEESGRGKIVITRKIASNWILIWSHMQVHFLYCKIPFDWIVFFKNFHSN